MINKTPAIIFDCDTGRDDAIAIWIALSKELPLRGVIASYGNTYQKNVSDNTKRVLAMAHAGHIPVFEGLEAPASDHKGHREIVVPRQDASGNGLCNLELPMAPPTKTQNLDDALTLIKNQDKPTDYIITGPASNLAFLIEQLGDDAQKHIGRIFMMGGKFAPLWDEIPGPDFNIACDPFAINTILKSGIPFYLVPMNATWSICMDLPVIETLSARGEIGNTAKALMIAHCRYFAPEPVFRFHDPTVIIAYEKIERFTKKKISIICDETNTDFARLIENENGHAIYVFETSENEWEDYKRDMLSHSELDT